MSLHAKKIRKIKDCKWEDRHIAEYDLFEKTKYVSIHEKTHPKVKKKFFECKSKNEKSRKIKLQKYSLEQILLIWLDNNKNHIKEQTYARYKYIINAHIIPFVGSIDVSQITMDFINDFISMKFTHGRLDGKGGLSASYTQMIAFILKSAVNFSANNQYCFALVGKSMKLKKNYPNLKVLTRDEQHRLEDYLIQDFDSRKIGILICLYTGIRLGELCGLEWKDVDLKNGTIQINQTVERIQNIDISLGDPKTRLIISKTKTISSNRIIPLSNNLLKLLERLYQSINKNSRFVLQGKSNEFTDPRTLQYSFKKYLSECNIRSIKFHTLRHSFATRCMESGMDMKTLSEILGHSNTGITMNTYVHSTLQHKKEKIEMMSLYCRQK